MTLARYDIIYKKQLYFYVWATKTRRAPGSMNYLAINMIKICERPAYWKL